MHRIRRIRRDFLCPTQRLILWETMNVRLVQENAEDLERLLVSVPTAALAIGVSSRWLWREISDGHLRTIRLGRRVMVDRRDLEVYIEQRREVRS